jgi:hypothetical protein
MISNTDRQLFQYRNATRLNALITGLYNAAVKVSPANLETFFDLDAATGDWLTKLAALFNVARVYSSAGDAFIWGYSRWGVDYWGGTYQPIADTMLRALLKARIKRETPGIKSIDYIVGVFQDVFAPDYLAVSEGTRSINIYIQIKDEVTFRNFVTIVDTDPKFFGAPTGVKVEYFVIV